MSENDTPITSVLPAASKESRTTRSAITNDPDCAKPNREELLRHALASGLYGVYTAVERFGIEDKAKKNKLMKMSTDDLLRESHEMTIGVDYLTQARTLPAHFIETKPFVDFTMSYLNAKQFDDAKWKRYADEQQPARPDSFKVKTAPLAFATLH